MSRSSGRLPRAYRLAEKGRAALRVRYVSLTKQLKVAGNHAHLIALSDILKGGAASINMTLPRCVRLLESGRWLNIYEATALETGASGRKLEREVERRLGPWYKRRRTIDRMLRFRRDTHYAALNIGGPGATRYGVCCAVLGTDAPWIPSTCFGGDSIRSIFDANGNQLRNESEVLSLFAVRKDLRFLAAVQHSSLVCSSRPGLDPSEVRGILEASDSLTEIHLHGPVLRCHVRAILMERGSRNHFWELAQRAKDMAPPLPQEYEAVPFFLRLVELLYEYKIPLKVAEDT